MRGDTTMLEKSKRLLGLVLLYEDSQDFVGNAFDCFLLLEMSEGFIDPDLIGFFDMVFGVHEGMS